MAEANQVNATQAREFLATYGHDAAALKTQPDDAVLKTYGTVSANHQKAIEGAVQEYSTKNPFAPNWRELMAGDDKDDLATLGRFQDPKAVWGRAKELTRKMSAGELKAVTAFPAKGTAEEQSQWRKDNGVPEKPEDYAVTKDWKLAGNVVVGEDDKPMVQDFLKFAHGRNWTDQQANGALEWYFGTYLTNNQRLQADADGERRRETLATLAKEWGPDYKRNMQAMTNLLARAPKGLAERIMGGRLADGTAIGDDPEMIKWLTGIELELNPHVTLTGALGSDKLETIQGRITEIEGVMKTDRARYNKDAAMQEELRNLYDARDRINARGKQKEPA